MPSSSPHASSSRRRAPTPVPSTVPTTFTASELSHLILDNSSVDMINEAKPDVAYAAHLRHISYVALTTKRLEQELDIIKNIKNSSNTYGKTKRFKR